MCGGTGWGSNPLYEKIEVELDPLISNFTGLARTNRKYIHFKTSLDNWNLLTVVGLFRYLGLVESFGAQLVDLLVLLLVANGYDFHVEREHEVPRIIHATSLKDLRNAFLGPKVRFLERCGLRATSKIVDVGLRNSIAHLDFEIKENGMVSARSRGGEEERNRHLSEN